MGARPETTRIAAIVERQVVAVPIEQPMTITVAPKEMGRLRLSALTNVVNELVSAVRELEASKYEDESRPADWFVVGANVLPAGAIAFDLVPDAARASTIANRFRIGLGRLAAGKEAPSEFGAEVLRHTYKALEYLDDGVASFNVTTPKGTTQASPALKSRVSRLVLPAYQEWTTIDGELKRIEWEDTRPRFVIVHALSGRRIRCEFAIEDLEKAKAAFPHRVEVRGMLRYNAMRQPVSIDIEEFTQIPDEHDLPSLDDLRGLNITGGLAPTEFIRRMRDDD